jgi:hypothetical protein
LVLADVGKPDAKIRVANKERQHWWCKPRTLDECGHKGQEYYGYTHVDR